MTKNDYLSDLRRKLARLPQSERDDAMSFYAEYFEDAGDDAAAIETLGSPIRLAAQINAEYSARMLEERDKAFRQPAQTAASKTEAAQPSDFSNGLESLQAPSQQYTRNTYTGTPYASPQENNTNAASSPGNTNRSSLSWIWAVILGFFALPVALPLAIVAIVLVIVIIVVCVTFVVALIAVVVALLVGSICTLLGIGAFSFGFGGGLISVGGAVTLLGLALILIPLVIMFCIWLVRAIAKLVTRIFNSLKRRSEKNEAAQ